MSTRPSDIRRESDMLWLEDATDSEAPVTARPKLAKPDNEQDHSLENSHEKQGEINIKSEENKIGLKNPPKNSSPQNKQSTVEESKIKPV